MPNGVGTFASSERSNREAVAKRTRGVIYVSMVSDLGLGIGALDLGGGGSAAGLGLEVA